MAFFTGRDLDVEPKPAASDAWMRKNVTAGMPASVRLDVVY